MAKANSLNNKRVKIDGIDDKILRLLNDRAKIVKEIGKIKAKNKDEIFSSGRESEILNRLIAKNGDILPDESVEDIFQSVFTACRALQKRLSIAYLGPEATFTQQVAIKHFGRNSDYIPVPSIKDVFSEVERKRADYGVVPIENSTEGVVNHTLDMFMDSDLVIAAERGEIISQNLLSVSGTKKEIRNVYSHPQALAQCRKWLGVHLPGVSLHESASTADAAVQATLDRSSAAIASLLAAQIYHLKPVALGIEDAPNNRTRFLIVGRKTTAPTGNDKTSILFSLKDKVGALYDILKPFREAKINMTKIESRPTKKKAWEYIFYVDFIGHQSEKRIQRALQQMRRSCAFLKILGSYPFTARK